MPETILRPDYADHPSGRSLSEESFRGNTTIKVLDDDEIEAMRVSSRLGREVLDEAAKAVGVGVTTDEIDRVVHEACIERDCYPSPLNYYNFPKSCCTSVNEVICHGIPDNRPLEVHAFIRFSSLINFIDSIYCKKKLNYSIFRMVICVTWMLPCIIAAFTVT